MRFEELQRQYFSTAYARQKASLKDKLESSLYALPDQKHLSNTLSIAFCRFLVTEMYVPTLVRKGFFPASALIDWLILP